ncbi:MAG TPA: cell division protein FtsH, partial [Gammaproteobacteria bacterium]|nr:cell division protein FtsH [Gammaproteobacteria bacterium]
YGVRTTGAEGDIEQATALARNMVTRWGMSDELGLVQLAPRANPFLGGAPAFGADRPFSEATAQTIDAEVRRLIGESYDEALKLLRTHRKALDALVAALLEKETLNETEILAVTGLPPAPELPAVPGDALVNDAAAERAERSATSYASSNAVRSASGTVTSSGRLPSS